MFSSADEVLKFIKDEDVQVRRRPLLRPARRDAALQRAGREPRPRTFFTEGQMFDGSSIRGFQAIHESDMKLLPDLDDAPSSTRSAPQKTLIVNFSIRDPFTDEAYSRDPRNIAAKAEAYLQSTGIADTAFFGARGRVLHLRLGPLRDQAERGLLLHRLDRGRVELGREHEEDGTANRGYKTRLQGRLLPGPAGRPLRRPARPDGPRPRARSASPSSAATTRSAPPARPRSTTGSTRCSRPPTTS